jgi:bifunctional non-homologous end joining protein LigD
LKLSEVHWIKPTQVAQVRYLTWTGDGLLRQVVYLGLRADKPPRQVVRERPV